MEVDDQPVSSYKIRVGGAFVDILVDINNRVSSPSSSMRSKKASKLLQYPVVRSRRFYRFEEEDIAKAGVLNRHVTELAGLYNFEKLNKTDVIWASTEAKDMEVALRSIVEATLVMNCWTFRMKSLSLRSTNDSRLVCCLSQAGARCHLLVAKTTSTLWGNVILKCRDAVLAKVKNSMSFESRMDLRNAKLLSVSDLFPAEVPDKAVEKSSKVLRDEAIWKAVSRDKLVSRGKKLHFSNPHPSGRDSSSSSPRRRQGPRRDCPSGSPPRHRHPQRLLPFPLAGGRGRSFGGSLPTSQLRVGDVLGRHWLA